MASNSGCTEVLVEGAITPNFLRKPSESVMGGSLPQVACERQWHRLRLSLRAGGGGAPPAFPKRRAGGPCPPWAAPPRGRTCKNSAATPGGGDAAPGQGALGIAARRPRRLYRQREGRGRHPP